MTPLYKGLHTDTDPTEDAALHSEDPSIPEALSSHFKFLTNKHYFKINTWNISPAEGSYYAEKKCSSSEHNHPKDHTNTAIVMRPREEKLQIAS